MSTYPSRRSLSLAAGLVVVAGLLEIVAASEAHALAFTPSEQRCRDTMASSGLKLEQVVAKVLAQCQRDRLSGARPAATDCNDVSQADTSSAVPASSAALAARTASRCAEQSPGLLHYTSCPPPCDASVPQIDTFSDAAACLACVLVGGGEELSLATGGSPSAPLPRNEARCHAEIDGARNKLLRTVLRERRRCEKSAERVGGTDATDCSSSDPRGKIARVRAHAAAGIVAACASVDLSQVAACSTESAAAVANCVWSETDARATQMLLSFYALPPNGVGVTTTSTTTTTVTTTTLPAQDSMCPATSELTLRAAVGPVCDTNADCAAGTCDGSLGRCRTTTELDTGWTGVSHDSDITEGTVVRAYLRCGGPFDGSSTEPCGTCYVTGLDPAPRNCRCANDNRTVCTQPFQTDASECGGNLCTCYLGPPLALSAGNTPVCVLNRFSRDIRGTVNVDTGETANVAPLRSVVHLGETLVQPCPVCGGTCTAPAAKVGQGCGEDLDCDSGAGAGNGVCGNYDPVVNDGVRGGTCFAGKDAGHPCDVDAIHTTFPAPQGGGASLDCFPSAGKNVSGTGLLVDLSQTTGSVSLSAGVLCGFPPSVSLSCPCGLCTGDVSVPCSSNADCAVAGGTCERRGGGQPMPNQCDDGVCTATGGGEGQCNANTPDRFCDAITRADGTGFLACQSNADCSATNIGVAGGNCTLTKPRECFLDPITATGSADAQQPISVGAFCIPPTANNSINAVAGLPGPGRSINQATSRSFCASDPNVEYVPGVGNCP